MFIVCSVIMQKNDRYKYLLIDAIEISIFYFSETLAVIFVAASKKQSLIELADTDELRIPLVLISLLIALILLFIFNMVLAIKRPPLTKNTQNIKGYEVVFFLILVLLQMTIMFGIAKIIPDKQLNVFLAAFSIGFCILNFGIYFMLSRLAEARQIEHENQLTKQQSDMQLKAYESILEQYNNSLRIVHDMRKHIRSLDALIKSSNDDTAVQYQQALYDELNSLYPNFRNDNQMLSVIINNAVSTTKRLNIEIELNIESVNLDFISPIDMTTIFCNLIDNAIESCSETDKKHIKISIMEQMNFITINIRNPYNKLNKVGNKYHSTKDGHFGIGLDNVRKALESYKGDLNIKTNDGIFSVTVIIPIMKYDK